MKELQDMSDHELLMELVREKRNSDRLRMISLIFTGTFLLILAVLFLMALPKIVSFYKSVQQMQKQLQDVEQAVKGLSESFGPETTDKIKEMLENLQKLFGFFGT